MTESTLEVVGGKAYILTVMLINQLFIKKILLEIGFIDEIGFIEEMRKLRKVIIITLNNCICRKL